MNIINVKVNFKNGTCETTGINLITGDYNSTKIVFDFDTEEGTKIFEMKSPSEELVMVQEIQNNEIILYGEDENENIASIFTEEGKYVFEVSLYENESKLTSASGKIKVKPEQVIINDELVEAYIPVFDQLMNDITSTVSGLEQDVDDKLDEVDTKIGEVNSKLLDVDNKLDDVDDKITEVDGKINTIEGEIETAQELIDQANNLDLDISKTGKTTTVTITKKDETTESENILDGKNMEFVWSGTSLGVRIEGDTEYTYVNLQGVQGPVGPQGEPFKIKKTYSSISEMNADFNNMNIGDYVMIANSVETEDNAKLYTKTSQAWVFITDFSGATGIQGPTGPAPSISIGTVTSGSESSVTRTGTDENPVFNFVLEKGDKGDTGDTGATGNGISNIEKINETASQKDYRINYTNGGHFDYSVENGEVTQAQLDELQAELDRYKLIENALPHITGSGTQVTLDNTAQAGMEVELEPSQLSQDGIPTPETPQDIHIISGDNTLKVSNKNIWDNTKFVLGTINGITLSINSKGELVLNGTSTAIANFNAYYFDIGNITKVALSGGTANVSIAFLTYTSDISYISAVRDSGSGATYTIPSNASKYALNIRVASGVTLSNYVLKAQIERGDTSSSYEEHKETLADVNLGVKNLYDFQNYKLIGQAIMSRTDLPNGSYLFTATGSGYSFSQYNLSLPAGTYCYQIDTNTKANYIVLNGQTQLSSPFTLTETATITFRVYIANATTGDSVTLNNIILEKGTKIQQVSDNPIEYGAINDYKDKFIRSSGKNLYNNSTAFKSGTPAQNMSNNIALEPNTTYTFSIGDNRSWGTIQLYNGSVNTRILGGTSTSRTITFTTDSTETRGTFTFYVGTSVDVSTYNFAGVQLELGDNDTDYEPYGIGNWVKKNTIPELVLTGDENWNYQSANNRFYITFNVGQVSGIGKSNKLIFDTNLSSNNTFSISGSYIYIKHEEITTATDFKTYLQEQYNSGSPIKIRYATTIPTYTPITGTLKDQLEYVYNQMLSYKGTTNISQVNNDLPFVINASALKDLSGL